MAKDILSVYRNCGKLVFCATNEHQQVTDAEELARRLRDTFTAEHIFFVVKPMKEEGKVVVDIDCMDKWRNAIYSMSEGQIWVGDLYKNDKYKVEDRQFVTNSPKTLADIVISMLAKDLPHKHVQEAEDAAMVWRPATEEEENDPSIKWEMEGTSKYGRKMINRERRIYRGLTMSEFYGGGIVD